MSINRARSGSIGGIQKSFQKQTQKLKGNFKGRSVSLGSKVKGSKRTSSIASSRIKTTSRIFKKNKSPEAKELKLQAERMKIEQEMALSPAQKKALQEAKNTKFEKSEASEKTPEETKVKYEALGDKRIAPKETKVKYEALGDKRIAPEESKVKYEALGDERIGSDKDIDADKYSSLKPEKPSVPDRSTKPKLKPRRLTTRQASVRDMKAGETKVKYDKLPDMND